MTEDSSTGPSTTGQASGKLRKFSLAEPDLLSFPVLDPVRNNEGGAHPSWIVKVGGWKGYMKCEDEGDGRRAVYAEVATWKLAKILELDDIVSPTVLRVVDSPTRHVPTKASIQLAWPDSTPASPSLPATMDLGMMDQLTIDRIATFEQLICNNDRADHNWLTVEENGKPWPKLIDNGRCYQATTSSSYFVPHSRGRAIPPALRARLQVLLRTWPDDLAALLEPDEHERLRERTLALFTTGVI